MEKMNGKSLDIEQMNIEKLKELFPNAVTEGKVDFDVLRNLLGDDIDEAREKYQFTWNGKAKSIKLAQSPSSSTLRPSKDKSKDWDNTENLYIEGDNLEVLKQLQKTYFEKIKMIYIDPPYNTGGDFVYKDDFKDSISKYKEQTKQNASSNPETSGRYHTDWLNMMYPRLILAKNLLKNDGVIFISIDHNEVNNLIKICDEIFGENNRIGIISTINNLKGRSDDAFFATCNEFLIVYAKNKNSALIKGFKLDDEELERDYDKVDEISAYKLIGFRKTGSGWQREERPFMFYPVLFKDNVFSTVSDSELKQIYNSEKNIFDDNFVSELTKKYEKNKYQVIWPTDENGNYGRWRWGVEAFLDQKDINLELNNSGTLCTKMRATLEDGSLRLKSAKTLWYKPEYDTGSSGKILRKIFNTDSNYFDNPKSLEYMKDIIRISTNEDDIVLDFFSGSGTIGHAIFELNVIQKSNIKFILVQLPELTNENSAPYKKGYRNICEIAEDRLTRVANSISSMKNDEESNSLLKEGKEYIFDAGFKVFSLDSTNFVPWDNATVQDEETISLYNELFKDDRTKDDILYEIMLKYGVFDQKVTIEKINGKEMFKVGSRYMIVCLEDKITTDDIKKIGELKPRVVVFRESGFDDDNDKINATHNLEKAGVEEIKCI